LPRPKPAFPPRPRRSFALNAIVDKAKTYQAHDDRVCIIDVRARTTQGPTDDYTLTSAYVGSMLPLMVELQHIERQEKSQVSAGS
jgi:hypothetical protein